VRVDNPIDAQTKYVGQHVRNWLDPDLRRWPLSSVESNCVFLFLGDELPA
jgi:hypothetical protein